MQTLPPPPSGRLIKTPAEFIEPVYPEQQTDLTPDEVSRWADFLDAGAALIGPITERLHALNAAALNGWCPSRVTRNKLDHLDNVLSAYHVAKYPHETRQTLDDAEAELAVWQTMSTEARAAIVTANERAEAEAAERRRVRQDAIARKNAIYRAAKQAGMPLTPAMEDALSWVA